MEIDEFLSSLKQAGLSQNTILAYSADLRCYLGWYKRGGGKNILSSSPSDISDYASWLRRRKKAAATRARRVSSLNRFFEWARKESLVPLNPVTGLKSVKVIRKNLSFAGDEEIEKLCSVIDTRTPRGIRDMAMLRLCMATGINVSDLIALSLSDVDLRKKRIMPAGDKERTISLKADELRALKKYISDARPLFVPEGCDEDTLFLSLKGKRMSRQGVWKNLRAYSEEAGIDNVTPERLRHGFVVRALINGEDPETLSRRLGLKSRQSLAEYLMAASRLKH